MQIGDKVLIRNGSRLRVALVLDFDDNEIRIEYKEDGVDRGEYVTYTCRRDIPKSKVLSLAEASLILYERYLDEINEYRKEGFNLCSMGESE